MNGGKFHHPKQDWTKGLSQNNFIKGEWGPQSEWVNSDLVVSPEEHISHFASTTPEHSIKGSGAFRKVMALFDQIEDPIIEWLSDAGFGSLYVALRTMMEKTNNLCLIRAIAERFWDTTNTFHLPFGEMTITPHDFTMITGLGFVGNPLEYNNQFGLDRASQVDLFGPIMNKINHDSSFHYEILFELVKSPAWADYREDQRRRVLLALFICTTIFANRGTTCYFHYLWNLRDLDMVSQLNWGEAAYATLIRGLREGVRKVSRGNKRSNLYLSGLWKVIELWCYEYFPEFSPGTKMGLLFPAAMRWGNDQLDEKKRPGELPFFRRQLNKITTANFRPWLSFTHPNEVDVARKVSLKRILFEGPFGFVWYLGERVTSQTLGQSPPSTPQDPPSMMFYFRSLTQEKVETWRTGDTYVNYINGNITYAKHLRRLMGPLCTSSPPIPRLPKGVRLKPVRACRGLPLPRSCKGWGHRKTSEAIQKMESLKYAFRALLRRSQRRTSSYKGGKNPVSRSFSEYKSPIQPNVPQGLLPSNEPPESSPSSLRDPPLSPTKQKAERSPSTHDDLDRDLDLHPHLGSQDRASYKAGENENDVGTSISSKYKPPKAPNGVLLLSNEPARKRCRPTHDDLDPHNSRSPSKFLPSVDNPRNSSIGSISAERKKSFVTGGLGFFSSPTAYAHSTRAALDAENQPNVDEHKQLWGPFCVKEPSHLREYNPFTGECRQIAIFLDSFGTAHYHPPDYSEVYENPRRFSVACEGVVNVDDVIDVDNIVNLVSDEDDD